MFQATRRRLALWYTAVTAVLLVLFASGVYLYVRNTLIERVDDTLNHVLEVVERSLVIEPAYSDADQFRINLEATFRTTQTQWKMTTLIWNGLVQLVNYCGQLYQNP
jgi:OmpR-family two-component system manganese-sensing sensor histidine kinase